MKKILINIKINYQTKISCKIKIKTKKKFWKNTKLLELNIRLIFNNNFFEKNTTTAIEKNIINYSNKSPTNLKLNIIFLLTIIFYNYHY